MANDRPYLLDVTRLIWRRWARRLPTGVDRVCLAYLDRYRHHAQAVIQRRGVRRILSERASDRLFDTLSDTVPDVRGSLVKLAIRDTLSHFRSLPGRGRLYFNVGHTALQDDGYLRWARTADIRPIFMIHDLIPITHPTFCRAGETERHKLRVRNMVTSGVGIIGNSQTTLDILAEFAGVENLALPPMLAAPLGTDARPKAPSTLEGRPTFVVLGTIEARKNHAMLLEIWSRLTRQYQAAAPLLLIIGQRGWECDQVFDLLDRSAALKSTVIEIGRCSDEELAAHLATARALLFPSLAEGYGIPIVEALSMGIPVIASDLTVFHEIGQGVPDLIDPLDSVAWEQAIRSYAVKDSAARRAQIYRMSAYRSPTWESHFSSVSAWLATL